MSEHESRDFRDDVLEGLEKTFDKLLNEKKKTNSELAFIQDGKVVKVKAVCL